MGSIRKILLVNVFGIVIIFIAFSAFAGMGGGHHMPNYGGYKNDMPNKNTQENNWSNQHFNHNQSMHQESMGNSKGGHNIQDGMMHNISPERDSRNPKYDEAPGQGMRQQQHFNEMGRD